MMRILYDAVNPNGIPEYAKLVASYKHHPNYPRAWDELVARFPNAVRVPIVIDPHIDDGTVLDCERYDATPADCPGWVAMRRRAGADPWVYCSASAWVTVRAEFARRGVAEPHYWIADYSHFFGEMYPGAEAHQYKDYGPYDASIVGDHLPGIDDPASSTGMAKAGIGVAVVAALSVAAGVATHSSTPSQSHNKPVTIVHKAVTPAPHKVTVLLPSHNGKITIPVTPKPVPLPSKAKPKPQPKPKPVPKRITVRSRYVTVYHNLTQTARRYGITLNALLRLNPQYRRHPNRVARGAQIRIR